MCASPSRAEPGPRPLSSAAPDPESRPRARTTWTVGAILVLVGLAALAVRLDSASDGTAVLASWSSWRADGVVVQVVGAPVADGLRDGDLVTAVDGRRLAEGVGGRGVASDGQRLTYQVLRSTDGRTLEEAEVGVVTAPVDWRSLAATGWGNLIFVAGLAVLAVALYVRRPSEPATGPLLLTAAGLFGSTLTVVGGLPALAIATDGPQLWLFHLSVIGVYSAGWGGLLAFSLAFGGLTRRLRTLVLVAALPLLAMVVWAGLARTLAPQPLPWIGLLHAGQSAVAAATLVVGTALSLISYLRNDPATRARLRWLGGGAALSCAAGLAGWLLPELILGHQLFPPGSIGLSGLPFVAGIAVALRRHELFDIERLANRSLVYVAVVAIVVAGYTALVVLLVSGLRLSGALAAGVGAAAAALALAPLRAAVQRLVNQLMYGDRDDPAAALGRLGERLQAITLPGQEFSTVVDTVAGSLRLPYAALEIVGPDSCLRPVAVHGSPVGTVHTETIAQRGAVVGRLLVSARGREDPLSPADLQLVASLARQVAPAIEAVQLHEDLLRSRAEVVALREDERRRIRRDLHDGLGPALAAIGLKAALAARDVGPTSPTRALLDQIEQEVQTSLADIRRLVEALRPPALDELGLVGALKARAAALSGPLTITVTGGTPSENLPAAVETAAYRIAVEAITNAVRHSGGVHCRVEVAIDDHQVQLTVTDDGAGRTGNRIGVGLRSMRERAAEIAGTVSITSPADGGTVVSARLPLRPDALPTGGHA